MRFQVFQIPLPYDGDMSELNQFVSTHRVVSVTQSIVRVETSPLLVFVVEYIDGQQSQVKGGSERIDYREKFTPEDFAFFSQLRDERKKIAEEAGVPIYTVLTNAQLAEIVERKIGTVEELQSISGVGKARIEKFGTRLIDVAIRFRSPSDEQPT